MAKTELGIQNVSLDLLVESPFWCRTFTEDEEFAELVESVKRIGVIEPPTVRPLNGKLEIVQGHRRVLAARKAELKFVLVDVRNLTDEEAIQIQFMENIHRKDLSDFEKAMFLKKMIDKFGYKQKELAEKIGKSQPWIANHLRMLQLEPENISREIIPKLEEGHARTILSVPEGKRAEVIEKVEETIKETGKPPTIRQIQNMTQIPKCERCYIHSSSVKPEKINGKDHNLCERCRQYAKLHHEEIVSHFRFEQQVKEGKVPQKLATPSKPQENWEHRDAHRKVQHSQDELDLLNELSTLGITPKTDSPICLWSCIPDGIYEEKKICYRVMNPATHKGKRLDADDNQKVELEKRGWTVLDFCHGEGVPKEWAKQVAEALKW